MSGPAYVSTPTVHYLGQLLDELAKGVLQIPRLQRRTAWSDEQRLQLLQGIRAGMPIGSFLVWRTEQISLQTLRTIGPHELPEPKPTLTSARSYLLDGLQRLATLFGCLRPLPPGIEPFAVDDEGKEVSWRVGFELTTEEFQVLERDEQAEPTWLPLSLILDSIQLLQFQRGLAGRSDVDRLLQRSDALAESFRLYKLPVVPLVTDDLATATRAFARIHHPGTRRAELQMIRALTWSGTFDLEERLALVQEQLAEVGWEALEPEWILEVCKAALGLDVTVEAPAETGIRLARSPATLEEATASLLRVASWLASQCGILSPRVVPHRLQLVMLAEVMRLRPKPDATTSSRLVRWFWHTTYAERFANLGDLQAGVMLEALRRVANGHPYVSSDERGPRFALPTGFNPEWARAKALALRLAALGPLDLDGSKIEAALQLAAHGASALTPIVPGLRGCAGRCFIQQGSKLRETLLRDATRVPAVVLRSHAITPEAAQALTKKDLVTFVELRGAEIRRLEEELYLSTQGVD